MATTKRTASQADRYKIGKLLEEHLTEKGSDGCVTYKGDMTDAKVAQLLGSHISPASVTNMRQQIFGHLRKPGLSGDARLARLEALFDQLLKKLHETFPAAFPDDFGKSDQ